MTAFEDLATLVHVQHRLASPTDDWRLCPLILCHRARRFEANEDGRSRDSGLLVSVAITPVVRLASAADRPVGLRVVPVLESKACKQCRDAHRDQEAGETEGEDTAEPPEQKFGADPDRQVEEAPAHASQYPAGVLRREGDEEKAS